MDGKEAGQKFQGLELYNELCKNMYQNTFSHSMNKYLLITYYIAGSLKYGNNETKSLLFEFIF